MRTVAIFKHACYKWAHEAGMFTGRKVEAQRPSSSSCALTESVARQRRSS